MFGLSGFATKLIAGGVILAALAGLLLWVEGRGYERAMTHCEEQRMVQELANREAAELASERLMRQADQLSLKNMELDDALTAIDEAAEADPDGGRICLSSDSANRLQSIR